MRCDEARQRMMTAAPEELEPEGSGALSAHLRRCSRCERRAAVLRSAQQELAGALDRMAHRSGPTTEVEPAGSPARPAGGGTGSTVRRWTGAGLGAALAAAAALVLWIAGGDLAPWDGSRSPLVEIGGGPPGARFELEVPRDGRTAVFRTEDPDLIVVWKYPDGR